MTNSGGHWKSLAEAQKLTQSTKVPGVIEEDVKRNPPLERLPVAQAAGTGLKIEWLREKADSVFAIESAATEAAPGDQLVWGETSEYEEKESTLRYVYIQRKLDRYIQNIYGTYNDYKAQVLLECEKGLKRKLSDRLVYADTTYGGSPTQFDGIHALAAEKGTPNAAATTTYSDLNLDSETGALSLGVLRRMIDAMKHGIDELWLPNCLGLRFDAAYDERGFTYAVSSNETYHYSLITRGLNDMGKPMLFFAGIPLVRTDFLVKEEDGTGTGASSNARAKYSSTAGWSIFGVRFGNIMERDPGICFAFGGTEGAGDLYELYLWERLEDFNAGGMRLDSYGTVLLGSSLCLGRIFDITDVALTA